MIFDYLLNKNYIILIFYQKFQEVYYFVVLIQIDSCFFLYLGLLVNYVMKISVFQKGRFCFYQCLVL